MKLSWDLGPVVTVVAGQPDVFSRERPVLLVKSWHSGKSTKDFNISETLYCSLCLAFVDAKLQSLHLKVG